MSRRPFRRGLEDLGNGLYAWMQPDGGWGWSNAGFVRDGEESLLVDTLFDEPLTADSWPRSRMRPHRAGTIRQLVNTHATATTRMATRCSRTPRSYARPPAAREMDDCRPRHCRN